MNDNDNDFEKDIIEALSKPKKFAVNNYKWQFIEQSNSCKVKIPLEIEGEPFNNINKNLYFSAHSNKGNLNLILHYKNKQLFRVNYKPNQTHNNPNTLNIPPELRLKRFRIGESRLYQYKYNNDVLIDTKKEGIAESLDKNIEDFS